ncbi:MAG: hypothetical protein UX37_C0002G0057 [Microgenomates group bacterium GW2011_GWA2_46_16]|nr:MAG: hypothetical protein UX37_C0002G0057 [Microgenomates group bacterium GW2011_GWA2_46_16]
MNTEIELGSKGSPDTGKSVFKRNRMFEHTYSIRHFDRNGEIRSLDYARDDKLDVEEESLNPLYVGRQVAETIIKVRIAAIDKLYVADHTLTRGHDGGHDKGGASTQIWDGHIDSA